MSSENASEGGPSVALASPALPIPGFEAPVVHALGDLDPAVVLRHHGPPVLPDSYVLQLITPRLEAWMPCESIEWLAGWYVEVNRRIAAGVFAADDTAVMRATGGMRQHRVVGGDLICLTRDERELFWSECKRYGWWELWSQHAEVRGLQGRLAPDAPTYVPKGKIKPGSSDEAFLNRDRAVPDDVVERALVAVQEGGFAVIAWRASGMYGEWIQSKSSLGYAHETPDTSELHVSFVVSLEASPATSDLGLVGGLARAPEKAPEEPTPAAPSEGSPYRTPRTDPVPEGQKRCSRCEIDYPANDEHFYRAKEKPDGLDGWCQDCADLRSCRLKQMKTAEAALATTLTGHVEGGVGGEWKAIRYDNDVLARDAAEGADPAIGPLTGVVDVGGGYYAIFFNDKVRARTLRDFAYKTRGRYAAPKKS